jgi:hypothetical protein
VKEARQLLEAARGETGWRPAGSSGWRSGYTRARSSDCSGTTSTLSAACRHRALQRQRGAGLVFTEPKTPRSRRTISLPRPLVDCLVERRERQAAERAEMRKYWRLTVCVHDADRYADRPSRPLRGVQVCARPRRAYPTSGYMISGTRQRACCWRRVCRPGW